MPNIDARELANAPRPNAKPNGKATDTPAIVASGTTPITDAVVAAIPAQPASPFDTVIESDASEILAAPKRGKVTDAFTAVHFKASDNTTVYPGRNGSKSQKLASVLVEINASGIFLKGSIYARQQANQPNARAEFSFFGANNQNCLAVDDPTSKVELDEWRAGVAKEYIQWRKANPHTTTGTMQTGADLGEDFKIA